MMLRFLRPSISRRVVIALVLSISLVWSALYFLGRLGVEAPEVGNFDREIRLLAQSAVQLADSHRDPHDLTVALSGLEAYITWNSNVHGTPEGLMSFRVTDASGVVLAIGGKGPSEWPAPTLPSGFFGHSTGGETYRMVRARSADGKVLVDVASSERVRHLVWDELMLSAKSFVALTYTVPLVLLPLWLAVRNGLKPLRLLSKELASRQPDDLSPVGVKAVYSELTPLTAELNGSFRRIATLLDRERSFLADAAHELRTPLAVMLAQVDTLRNAASEQARQASLKRLDGGLLRASRLVNQLLSLARLEADVEEAKASIDLADLARDCLAMYAQMARTQGIELSYVGPDSLIDECPRHCLDSIMDNLVGNAVRYGGPGSHIEVGLSRLPGGRIQLQVRDDGPGVPKEEMPHLFERFRRGKQAVASGSGLGLAIVKSAARQMSARIEVLAGLDGKGIEFKLDWPARAS